MFKFLLFIFVFMTAAAEEKLIAAKEIENEKRFINRVWKGNGIVVVGKIKNHQNYKTASRIPIQNDGSFCTAVYKSRELIFLCHGYEPLTAVNNQQIKAALQQKNGDEIPLIKLGEIEFTKSPEDSLRSLKGKIDLQDAPAGEQESTLTLFVQNDKYLWEDHGNEGGAVIRQTALITKVKPGQNFHFDKLSRLPYLLKIESPGYISQYTHFDEKFSGEVHFGNIVLFPAPFLEISYRARIRKNGGQWIEDKKDSKTKILCNGEASFLFSKLKDGLGNVLDLRIRPDDDGVKASFFYHRQNSFYKLGKMDLKDLNWDVNLHGLKGDTKAYLNKGECYYFNIKDINGTEIQLIFKVEE